MRQPYAQALCESTVHQGPPQGYIYKGGAPGAAASGRRPPVEESLVDILEEDPGAQGFRIGLAHRAGAYPEAAILSSGFGQATNQPTNQFSPPPPRQFRDVAGLAFILFPQLAVPPYRAPARPQPGAFGLFPSKVFLGFF